MAKKIPTNRSWFTTITASSLGLLIAAIIVPLIPLNNATEMAFFCFGLLLVVLCVIIAIQGKKGTIVDIIYSLSFWS